MIPADNEWLNDKMEGASLHLLMPGFDKEAEWAKLSQKLHPPVRITSGKNWAYAEAVIVLMLCCGGLSWLLTQKAPSAGQQADNAAPANNDAMHERIKSVVAVPQQPQTVTIKKATASPDKIIPKVATQPSLPVSNKETTPPQLTRVNTTTEKHHYDKKRLDELFDYYRTKEFICNTTPCPLQICILQTIKCSNGAPAAVATCSTIEPDQARQLKYKINNSRDCNVTIDEIRITRVNTGETIVLNADSRPSTAQDLFDYITGEKEGDLLTGIFHSDCYKNTSTQNLTIDKGYGDFIIK